MIEVFCTFGCDETLGLKFSNTVLFMRYFLLRTEIFFLSK